VDRSNLSRVQPYAVTPDASIAALKRCTSVLFSAETAAKKDLRYLVNYFRVITTYILLVLLLTFSVTTLQIECHKIGLWR
jgi:hypothetical protein